jgi:hypothetical protein
MKGELDHEENVEADAAFPPKALHYDDPHRAALEDNPASPQKLTLPVILSAIFLGTSFVGPIIFGFILISSVLVQLSQKLGGPNIDFWIPSG